MIKIILITFICAFLVIYLKNTKNEYADIALIASSVLVLFLSIDYVINTYELLNKIVELSKLDYEYYKIIFKIISISYVFEFVTTTIEDMGLKSLAIKLVLVGKILILGVSAPIIYAVFNLLNNLL